MQLEHIILLETAGIYQHFDTLTSGIFATLPDREKPIRSIWMNWDIADLQMQFMKSLQDEA